MDQEIEKIIKERYQILPDDVKKSIAALPLQTIMQDVAQKNGLHIDQAGVLYTETMLILLGVEGVDAFEKNIATNLSLSPSDARGVTLAINEKVFLPIRESLKAIQKVQIQAATAVTPEPAITRDNILAEIENPTPSTHPITVPAQETATTVAHDFIGSKLTQTVAIPSQKATVSLQSSATPATPATPKPTPKPAAYAADPYRESIN